MVDLETNSGLHAHLDQLTYVEHKSYFVLAFWTLQNNSDSLIVLNISAILFLSDILNTYL
jgi:hypothetical protein